MEKIRLKLKAYDHRVLDRSVASIIEAVKRTGAELIGPIPMPTKIRKYTVLKSPHVNKDSREQFEIRVHSRMIDIVSATPDTVDSLMKLDLAPEVDVEVRSMGQEQERKMEFIVEKIGMSRTVTVPATPVTLVKVVDAKVCEVNDGVAIVAYSDGKKFNKAIEGQQKKYNLSKEFNRFATLNVANTEAGEIDTTALVEGVVVKSTFTTKGRGFSGVVKRHGFAGGRGSHGHRMGKRTGSIGNCEWPGRVMKGKKMPGQYGNTNVTHKNDVVSFDATTGILVLKGSVAGANGTLGKVRIA